MIYYLQGKLQNVDLSLHHLVVGQVLVKNTRNYVRRILRYTTRKIFLHFLNFIPLGIRCHCQEYIGMTNVPKNFQGILEVLLHVPLWPQKISWQNKPLPVFAASTFPFAMFFLIFVYKSLRRLVWWFFNHHKHDYLIHENTSTTYWWNNLSPKRAVIPTITNFQNCIKIYWGNQKAYLNEAYSTNILPSSGLTWNLYE